MQWTLCVMSALTQFKKMCVRDLAVPQEREIVVMD